MNYNNGFFMEDGSMIDIIESHPVFFMCILIAERWSNKNKILFELLGENHNLMNIKFIRHYINCANSD